MNLAAIWGEGVAGRSKGGRICKAFSFITALVGGCCVLSGAGGFAEAQGTGDMPAQLAEEVQALRQENEELSERLLLLEAQVAAMQSEGRASIPRLPQQVELCGERVPLERWHVRERLEREFYLLLGDEALVILLSKRSGRYFPYIQEQLQRAGLPDDLKYVAVAESALMPTAYSSSGAAGLWQFISSTGGRYGLRLTSHMDERRDLMKATGAAFRYLSDLYQEFNSWPLALAAYNAGEERVRQAIDAQGVRNYYELSLPLETERYVFRIIASKLILSEPERYGFTFAQEDLYRPLACDEVEVKVRGDVLPLRTIAEATGSYSAELRRLNPALRTDYLSQGDHLLRVPSGTGASLLAMLGKSDDGSPRKVVHRVRKGETLWGIADRYGVRLASLREWNGLKGSTIRPGDMLTVYAPEP